jgi:hypothetical protein
LKALVIAIFLKIPCQDFKANNGWAVRFMRCKGLAVCRRTTVVQNLSTAYVEKLIAYQRHIIDLCQKYYYLLRQIGNADKTPVFFDMPASSTVNVKGSKSVPHLTKQEDMKNRITVMLSVMADGRKHTSFVIVKRECSRRELPTELY